MSLMVMRSLASIVKVVKNPISGLSGRSSEMANGMLVVLTKVKHNDHRQEPAECFCLAFVSRLPIYLVVLSLTISFKTGIFALYQ